MTDLRKAAEMALKRLDMYFVEHGNDDDFAATQALRQALAQPDLAKIGEVGVWGDDEPVGYVTIEEFPCGWRKVPSIKWFRKPTEGPLYTAPPKREWVGLSDEEIYDYADKFLYSHGSNYGIKSFGKAIEAKLKDKNT